MKNVKQEAKEEFEYKKSFIDFLKPNKWKIIILFILFLYLLYIIFFYYRISCDFGGCKIPNHINFIYKFLFILDNKLLETIFPDVILIILEITYLYTLSCLSYLIIHKIIKNVKNK